MRYLIVRADGSSLIADGEVNLKFLQQTVGGFIEAVFGYPGWHAYINEEGKLLGLEVNNLATQLCRKLGWDSLADDIIVGNAIFFGDSSNGDEADVTDSVLETFHKLTN